jgi:hypothetical protein
MVNVAAYPILVDGVRLDTLAYGVTEHRVQVAAVRAGDLAVPGADGVVASVWDDSEPAYYGLTMQVRGRDDDGAVPGGSSAKAEFDKNLDEIIHLFRGSPHRLKTITQERPGGNRRALVKVVDVIAPDESNAWDAEVAVSCLIPGSYWEDEATADWSQAGAVSGTAYAVTTLAGATAPIHDGVILVTGPVTNPVVTDPYTGAQVSLAAAVPAGDAWRLNCATWSSRTGTGLTLASADTTGTDRTALTSFQGGSSRYLSMVPERTARNTRRVRLTLTGTGLTGATALAVRARRKYL